MLISLEERLLIDRYLEGTLSGLELQNFMERLDSDEDFRARVSMQNLLVEGIIISADKELQERLLESLAYKKSRVPFGLKLIMTFLLLVIVGISLWNYIGTDRSSHRKDFLSFSWLTHSSRGDHASTNKADVNELEKSGSEKKEAVDSKSKEGSDGKSGKIVEQEEDLSISDSLDLDNQIPEVVVKKDQMIISQSLFIHEDSTDQDEQVKSNTNKKSSQSKNVAKKLNPMAGLEMVEDEKAMTKINVEFWVSPINYRGYKFFRNKIILFGIEEPDAVRLFRRRDNIYMQIVNNYYLLEPTEEFASYQSVQEKEVSSLQGR